jgi:hypothetical protein
MITRKVLAKAKFPRLGPILAALAVVTALSGCIIVPYPGPGYYHHHRDWR